MFVVSRIQVLPFGRPLVGQDQCRGVLVGQLASPGNVIRVNMRVGGRDNLHFFPGCGIKVLLDVSTCINDDRLARFLAADHVGCVCQGGIVEVFQQHLITPCLTAAENRAASLLDGSDPF